MIREVPMPRSAPVDGFSLAYDRSGTGEPVVLLHGWPGDRTDYRVLGPALALASSCDVIVPDLRGFGESDKHPADPAEQYSPAAQARSVAGLVGELGLDRVLLAGSRRRWRRSTRSWSGRWSSLRRCRASGRGCSSPGPSVSSGISPSISWRWPTS
jgi:hypothetical protein